MRGKGRGMSKERRFLTPHPSSLIPLLCLAVAGCRIGDRPSVPPEKGAGPAVRFTDVTAAAGISFRHVNGAEGKKYMPETMGSGCAFIDYDNDGWQDLLFVNGEPWSEVQAFRRSGRRPKSRNPPPTMALYRNDGTGRFHEVTAAVGLDVPMYGMGVAIGDWDNDGFDDLAITALGGVYLFHNLSGRRFELSETALVTPRQGGMGVTPRARDR